MEVTFTPGLTDKKGEDETTLEKYQRKLKEKKKKRKEEVREAAKEKEVQQKKKPKQPLDDFFDADSESEEDMEEGTEKGKKGRKTKTKAAGEPRTAATAEELALLVASDNPNGAAKHFDMSAVLKAEKKTGKKSKKGRKEKNKSNDQDTQEYFRIDVGDERFKALHEDHTFAIDPSNPQ